MEDNQQMHPIEAIIRLVIGGGLLLIPFFFAFQTCSESDEKELYSSKNTEAYVGTYTATDFAGTNLTFILSEDGSAKCIEEYKSIYGVANSYSKNNEFGKYKQTETKTHYGSWSELSKRVPCEITIKNGPVIYFSAHENSNKYGSRYQIKDGYLYTDIDDCKAAHPERRLKLTKQ